VGWGLVQERREGRVGVGVDGDVSGGGGRVGVSGGSSGWGGVGQLGQCVQTGSGQLS
jgi:hypothetical protein